MPEYAFVILVLAVPVAGFLALRRAGAFVVAEEAAILRLSRRLGRERRPTVADRLSRHSLLRTLDEARDLRHLLLVAGEDITPGAWGLRIAAAMLITLGAVAVLNILSVVTGNGLALSWPVMVLVVVAVPILGVLRLRLRAARLRDNAGRAFGELAAVLAALGSRPPLRNPTSIEPTDLVAMMSTWIDDPALRTIVAGNRWRRLADEAGRTPASESEWFQLIGELYGIHAALRVAEVVRVSRELNAGDVSARYLLTARHLSRERLADLRARNRRAMVTQVVPTIGLVAALMILVLSALAAIHLGGS